MTESLPAGMIDITEECVTAEAEKKRREEPKKPNGFDLNARPQPDFAEQFGVVIPTDEMLQSIRPRRWLYGNYLIRGHVAVLAGISGGGKSSLAITMSVEMAARHAVLDHHLWRPGLRVYYFGLDDPLDEHFRRLRAALSHHKLTLGALGGRLSISDRNDQFIIVTRDAHGTVVATPIFNELVKYLREQQIDVLIIDPFIRSHELEENSNSEMAAAMKLWTRIAEAANCAVLLLHHVRKGLTDADDQQAIRGAGAIVDLARTGLVLTKMTSVEANTLGLEDTRRRRFYFRLGHPKASMAPPPTQAEWYQLISVKIRNPDDEYPEGDNMQAVERWHPPSLFAGIDRSQRQSSTNYATDPSPASGIASQPADEVMTAGQGM